MKIFSAVVASPFLVGILSFLPSVEPADWPMLGLDATRNAVSPERGGPPDWSAGEYDPEAQRWDGARNILWTGQLSSSCIAQPVLSNGLIWGGRRPCCTGKLGYSAGESVPTVATSYAIQRSN